MKKIVIVFAFLLLITSIFSIGSPDSTKENTSNITLSLGIASGGSIGVGKIKHFERTTKEITSNFHYQKNSDYYVAGVYGQITSYRNKQRVGFFTLFMAGLDYTKGQEYQNPIFGIPGGSDEDDYDKKKFEGIFPNLVIGCGYSIKLSQNKRMLIYLDLGIKRTFSNLNLSVTF